MIEQLLKGVREMRESVTYQAILKEGEDRGVREGEMKGRLAEARALLLRLGTRQFGAPSPDVTSRLQALNDLPMIESLVDRLLETSSWDELLRTGK